MAQDHPWTAFYDPSVRREIDRPAYRTLGEMVSAVAKLYGDKPAFTTCLPNGMNGTLSFADVDEMSDALAIYLRETAGLAPGDRVALQVPNGLSFPVAAFGVLKAGCILVNINPLYTAEEMARQFADAEPAGADHRRHVRRQAAGGDPGPPDPQHHRHAGRGVPAGPAARHRASRAETLGPDAAADRPAAYPPARGHRGGTVAARGGVDRGRKLPRGDRARRRRLPAIHRRDHRHLQGRDAHPCQPDHEHGADHGPGHRAREGRRGGPDRAAALPHLRLHREPARASTGWARAIS